MPRPKKAARHLAHIRTLAIASSAQKRLERAAAAAAAPDEDDLDAPWFPELGTDVAYTPEEEEEPVREPEVLPEKRRTRAVRYPPEIALPMRNSTKTRKQKEHLKRIRGMRGKKRERSWDEEESRECGATNGDGVEREGVSREGLLDLVGGVIGGQGGGDAAPAPDANGVSREELLGLLEGALDIRNYEIADTSASASTQLLQQTVGISNQNSIVQQAEEVLSDNIGTFIPQLTPNEQSILLPSTPALEGTSATNGTLVTPSAQDPPLRMLQLKQWNPKTDGKHLPALRGRAGTGNSDRNVQRKKAKVK